MANGSGLAGHRVFHRGLRFFSMHPVNFGYVVGIRDV